MSRRRGNPATLPPEHVRFIAEYLIDDNGTRAYKAAYPEAAYTTCRNEAAKLLAKPCIRKEVQAARLARQKRTLIRADTALREAARLAYSDPLYLFEDDGVTPRTMRDIPPDTRRTIAAVKVRRERVEKRTGTVPITCPACGHEHAADGEVKTTHEVVEYKLWPKPAGLDKVFKHLGLEQEIAPLDALLAALPEDLAGQVRAALEAGLRAGPGGGRPAGGG